MPEINPQKFLDNYSGRTSVTWSLELEEDQTIDIAFDRAAWKTAVAARPVKAGHLIEVRSHDNSRYWKLLVLGTGPGWLKATPIEASKPDEMLEIPDGCPLTTKWIVGNRTYSVIRVGDNTVLKAGFAMKNDAVKWIAAHLQDMSRAA